MPRRAMWGAAVVLAAVLLQSLWTLPIGWAPRAVVLTVFVLAAVRPYDALVLFAAVAPVAGSLFVLLRTGGIGLRFAEALTLAYLAGWAGRHMIRPRLLTVAPRVLWSAVALIGAAAASALIDIVISIAERPGSRSIDWLTQFLSRDYLFSAEPVAAAVLLIECLALLLAVADVCGTDVTRRVGVLRMMVVGAAASTLVNLTRLLTAAMSREHPWSTFATYLATVRTDLNIVDLNAAGSYFVMIACVAAGLAGRSRRFAIAGLAFAAAGLWIAGSRVALAAALLTAACALVALLARVRGRRFAVIAALLFLVAASVAGWLWYPHGRNATATYAVNFRIEMGRAALHLAASHPVFGVGLGRFYGLSDQYASIRENAHNNFLQMLAELGIVGLVLFVLVVAHALHHEVTRPRPPGPAWGIVAGLAAFLLTSMGGHPLLVPGAAYAFWMVVGIASAPAAVERESRMARYGAIAVLVVIAATLPLRVRTAIREADVEQASVGLARLWQHDPAGVRYRWAGGRSAFFAAASSRALRVPLRLPGPPDVVEVRILVDGRDANRLMLRAGEDWRTVFLLLPGRDAPGYLRIDLEARVPGAAAPLDVEPTPTSGVLMVGRPTID